MLDDVFLVSDARARISTLFCLLCDFVARLRDTECRQYVKYCLHAMVL